jgi:hypothetical protein
VSDILYIVDTHMDNKAGASVGANYEIPFFPSNCGHSIEYK